MEGLPLIPDADEILQIHNLQLARFGGAPGVRDRNGVESAVGRALNLFAYNDAADVISAAVTLCHSIVKNRSFVDGNKRTAHGALRVTLVMNNLVLAATPVELADFILAMATGDTSQQQAETWVRARTVTRG